MISQELSSEISGILKTKLYVPQLREDLVPRPRLIEKINRGVQGKLVLVTAPAGFGKSTLLAEWAEQAEMPVVWLSLDRTDNHPHMFFSYFIASIQTRFPGFGESIQAALNSHASPFLYSLVNALINEITELNRPCAIVLDDFHRIVDPITVDSVCHLVDHQPPHLHILIASRSELRTSCSRMRVRGELIQLGIEDLRFNFEEASAFLRGRLGRRISGEEIAILENRTEGWIAGLQMAVISMQAEDDVRAYVAGFSGADRLVTDFLLDEVLSHQGPEVQDFMLKTSILDKLSAPLCNQVTGSTNSQELLENLDRSGLFVIPLDSTRTWYRYHHLFAELLQNRLEIYEPELKASLHRKASDWYLAHEMPEEAVEQLMATGDFNLVVQRVEQVSMSILLKGKFKTFIGWMEKIPRQYLDRNPYLVLLQAYMLFELSDLRAFHRCMQLAESLLALKPTDYAQTSKQTDLLQGILATIWGTYYCGEGEVEQGLIYAKRAFEYLPNEPSFWRTLSLMIVALYYRIQGNYGAAIENFQKAADLNLSMQNLFLAFISITILGKLYLKTGKLTQAINICQKALDLDAQQGYKVSYSGLIYLLMGELCFLQADLDSAERYLLHGIDLVEKHEDVYSVIHGYFNLARVHLSRGEAEVAQEFMNRMVSLISDLSPSKNALRYSSVCQAYIWLYAGSLKAARKWMRSADHDQLDRSHPYDVSSDYAYRGIYLAPQDMVSESLEFIRLTEARLMIGVGDPDAALAILDQILVQPDNLERIYYRIQALILRSLAMMTLAHPEKAAIDLQAAIRLAAPEGLIQLFVLEAEALYPVLDRVAEKFVETNKYSSEEIIDFQFVERLFYRLANLESAKKRKVYFDLTPREIQVIKWLSKGLSYKETAKRAIISENTFRTHVKRIYRKLGVNNRLQAVNKAKKFGLLE